MVENQVDSPNILIGNGIPVVRSQRLQIVFLERVFVVFVVVGDLCCFPGREADLAMCWARIAAGLNQVAALFLARGSPTRYTVDI